MQKQPSFDYVHSNKYPIKKIKYAADISSLRDKSKLKEIISFMKDEETYG